MVVINIKIGDKDGHLYMDDRLYRGIETKLKPRIQSKDKDLVLIVDGEEGVGKSVFSMQLAKVLDPNFNLSQICFSPEEFEKAIKKAQKGACIIYDEAYEGLASTGSLTEVTRTLVALMTQMRQKNLYVIIVLPTFFMLKMYVSLFRSRGLFNIYEKNGKRGFWKFFNKRKKKILYLTGKKFYSYKYPRSNFLGKFTGQYVVDENEYRKKKEDALTREIKKPKYHDIIIQRNALIHLLYTKFGVTQSGILRIFKENGYMLAKSGISQIISELDNKIKNKKNNPDSNEVQIPDLGIQMESKQEENTEEDGVL